MAAAAAASASLSDASRSADGGAVMPLLAVSSPSLLPSHRLATDVHSDRVAQLQVLLVRCCYCFTIAAHGRLTTLWHATLGTTPRTQAADTALE